MEIVKVYKYDSTQEANGYKGEDYSKYVQIGGNNLEDMSQELDTGEITLVGMPIREAFTPETKLIIETVERIGEEEEIVETLHRVVQKDMVGQPILTDNNYFDHHITLIEPSVIAQKRLTDNISATYKLKSVTLDRKSAYPATIVPIQFRSAEFEPDHEFWGGPNAFKYRYNGAFIGKYFQTEGQLGVLKADGTLIDNEYINIGDITGEQGETTVRFQIPKLEIYSGDISEGNGFHSIGYASIDYIVEEFDITEDYNPERSWSGSFISKDRLGLNNSVTTPYIPSQGIGDTAEFTTKDQDEWLVEYASIKLKGQAGTFYLRKYSDTTQAENPTYITQEIPISVNKKYRVRISLHEFPDEMNKTNTYGNSSTHYKKSLLAQPCYRYYNKVGATIFSKTINEYNEMTEINTSVVGTFNFYADGDKISVYASAMPYSALALLQKAIVNSSLYEKEDGVYIADINNENVPFYIDTQFIDELSSALVIENFYNQKNLWEIMIEVGNYIHAIPELKFGKDDKFLITFNRLGRTDQQTNQSNKASVFNSRGVEDYISSTSSYIQNMVQLGGYIEEWVAPKTTSETYLVSNDTAEIVVSKPIIELLSITVKSNINQTIGSLQIQEGQTADLTEYIFEENVYKTLGIEYDLIPNKGTAMYYSLGTNKIVGGQYQLPQSSTTIYSDYTIKKIIWGAFNGRIPVVEGAIDSDYWETLKVTDFSFLVKYRTKDSVRQNHTRPDLRKYLLNSKYDRYPEQNQFNNQTDVVVDSIKFGNNIYGKLIKTGNNEYTITEWNDRYENLKHKGELYRINDELYYVVKANHYNFSSHFLSEITFSKDYNQLSQIIGIPSEPRFYEISEQSLIWREVAINDLLLLTDNEEQLESHSNYVFNYDHLADLVLGEGTDFARYALTVFKGDKNSGNYSQTVGQKTFYTEVINPINAYSSENTLTYEWDMEDNYSAGDKVTSIDSGESNADEGSYTTLSAVKYTDVYGRADLLDFYILGNIENEQYPLTVEDVKAFPESPISTKQEEESKPFVGDFDILATNVKTLDTNYNGRGIGLLKDCREALSINYNLQLITNSDTFVLSPYFFLPQKENVRIVLLAEEVNKLSTGYINNSIVITPTDRNGDQMETPYFDFEPTKIAEPNSWDNSKQVIGKFALNLSNIFHNVNDGHFTESNLPRVKAIAVLCDVSLNPNPQDVAGVAPTIPNKTQFVIARNIPEDFQRDDALATWFFGSPNKNELFKNKQ